MLRVLTLALVLLLTPLTHAQDETVTHVERLVYALTDSFQSTGSKTNVSDRFADAAKAWAQNKKTKTGDRQRLKQAVAAVRLLMGSTAASLTAADFQKVDGLLRPLVGKKATPILASIREAIFTELANLVRAARAARIRRTRSLADPGGSCCDGTSRGASTPACGAGCPA